MDDSPTLSANEKKELRQILQRYQQPSIQRSAWQLVNSIVPFIALWVLMVYSLQVSYWLTLALSLPAAGFMVRTFIIFHDCGHGSFFKTAAANDITGIITGVLVFTPYYYWRHDHAIHHATSGDLDRRGVGDVNTLTVEEYKALPWHRKAIYRVLRNPLILFTIGSFLLFTIFHRFCVRGTPRRERNSVIATDLALAGILTGLVLLVGWKAVLLIQCPIMFIAASAGVWLFYVQHNFTGTYWARHGKWDFYTSAMKGASFYKLPLLLQWFSGNIGFHHIHHLNAKIPNYLLPNAYRENAAFHVPPVTLRSSLESLSLRLWDEKREKLVGYEVLKV